MVAGMHACFAGSAAVYMPGHLPVIDWLFLQGVVPPRLGGASTLVVNRHRFTVNLSTIIEWTDSKSECKDVVLTLSSASHHTIACRVCTS